VKKIEVKDILDGIQKVKGAGELSEKANEFANLILDSAERYFGKKKDRNEDLVEEAELEDILMVIDSIFSNLKEASGSEPTTVDEFRVLVGPDLVELIDCSYEIAKEGGFSAAYIEGIDKNVTEIFNELQTEFNFTTGSRKIKLLLINVKNKVKRLI
jgi:hypothetical protein